MIDYDDVDLQPYLRAIIKRKWVIIPIGLIPAIIALITSLVLPAKFTATSTILLTRQRPALSLAEQFPTINEPVDTRSRMDALVTIAKSDDLAFKTIQALGGELPAKNKNMRDMQKNVEITSYGDSIQIATTAQDPQLAAMIANTYAKLIAETINAAYSGEQPLVEFQEQLNLSKSEYEKSQSELEAFILQNPTNQLRRQIDETRTLLDKLGYERAARITYFIQRKQAMEELVVQAKALMNQLQGGSTSNAGVLGDSLAVMWARMNALGLQSPATTQLTTQPMFPPQEVIIDLQSNNLGSLQDDSASYGSDLDALISLAEEQRLIAEENIQRLSEEVLQGGVGEDSTFIATAVRLQDLETQLENARAREQELTGQRDIAWSAYQALAAKETEIKSAALTSNQVYLTSLAIPPEEPDPSRILLLSFIGLIVGLTAGIFWVVLSEWWQIADLGNSTTHN